MPPAPMRMTEVMPMALGRMSMVRVGMPGHTLFSCEIAARVNLFNPSLDSLV